MLDKLPPSWRARITPETQAKLLLQHRLGLRPSEATLVVRTYLREHPAAFWLPDLAGLAAFFAWMWSFGQAHDAIDATFENLGWFGMTVFIVVTLLTGYGMAAVVTTVSYTGVRNHLLLRPIRRCVELPACFHCDHSLEGIPRIDSRLTCPECGTLYPLPGAPNDPCKPRTDHVGR